MSARRSLLITIGAALIVIAAIAILIINLTSSAAVIVVHWSTASELDTAGFNVYRSEQPDGPFTRLNAEIIPASPDPLVGGTYVFTDTNVMPGRTYYYQLEDVDTNGGTNIAGSIHETAQGLDPSTPIIGVGAGLVLAGLVALITRKRQIRK